MLGLDWSDIGFDQYELAVPQGPLPLVRSVIGSSASSVCRELSVGPEDLDAYGEAFVITAVITRTNLYSLRAGSERSK